MATATQITTGRVRFSYVKVFAPDTESGKFSTTLIIPKSDKTTLGKIAKAMNAAKAAYLSRNPGKKLPSNLASTMHDGDGEKPNGGEYGPECKGCFVMSVSSKNKPVIVNADKTPLSDPQELYSGCYGRAIINFYVYDNTGNKGLSAGLNGIMKLSDGEPLAGGIVTDADWDDDFDDTDVLEEEDILD